MVGLTVTKDGILPMPEPPSPIVVLLLVQVYTVPATGPLMVTAAVLAPAHTVWLAIAFTAGVGFTVMVKLTGAPPQPVDVGVTVMVAVIGALVLLVAVKAGILPVPAAANPMAVLLLVQLYTVPATAPVKFTAAVADPLHNTCGNTAFTVGIGFTVTVKLVDAPVQLPPPLV